MGYCEVQQKSLEKADSRLLQCENLEYALAKANDDTSVDPCLTDAQQQMNGLGDAVSKQGAQGGEGFYANLGTADNPNWVKADTIAGGNKLMMFMKGATDIAQNQSAGTSKLQEGVKIVQRPFNS